MLNYVGVVFPYKWSGTYTYSNPLGAIVGQIVSAPIKNKKHYGIVWCGAEKIDSALDLHQAYQILTGKFLKFMEKAAQYNVCGVGEILGMCLRGFNVAYSHWYLHEGQIYSASFLIDKMGKIKFKKLVKTGCITPTELAWKINIPTTDGQKAVAIEILSKRKPVLLKGMTGAGKTNVYFCIVAESIKKGEQCLILMPEIALTYPFLELIQQRFGFAPHIWNHSIDRDAKDAIFDWACSGKPGILIGSRSALWLPFKNLGCIVVDEEHDLSYKQESNPRYHARDMAVLRAFIEGCRCVLVSATPSLETWHNVTIGKYNLVEIQGSQKIKVQLVKRKNHWLSEELKYAVADRLQKGQQSIIFLNRRGFASSIFCTQCKATMSCRNCSTTVLFYKNGRTLCSYCGYQAVLQACAHCKTKSWKVYGIGVERLQEDLQTIFPNAKTMIISSDSENLKSDLELIQNNQVDIIIGTQIIAKGYNFPNLGLVGVVQADQGLASGDFRNTENVYQLLTQVKGRCGRFDIESLAILQTNDVESPLLKAIATNDFAGWVNHELELRKHHMLPPFNKLIRILTVSKDFAKSEEDVKVLYNAVKSSLSVTVYPPSPAELHKYKASFRHVILIRYTADQYPQAELYGVLHDIKLPNKSNIIVDVDPYRFF